MNKSDKTNWNIYFMLSSQLRVNNRAYLVLFSVYFKKTNSKCFVLFKGISNLYRLFKAKVWSICKCLITNRTIFNVLLHFS